MKMFGSAVSATICIWEVWVIKWKPNQQGNKWNLKCKRMLIPSTFSLSVNPFKYHSLTYCNSLTFFYVFCCCCCCCCFFFALLWWQLITNTLPTTRFKLMFAPNGPAGRPWRQQLANKGCGLKRLRFYY